MIERFQLPLGALQGGVLELTPEETRFLAQAEERERWARSLVGEAPDLGPVPSWLPRCQVRTTTPERVRLLGAVRIKSSQVP